MSETSAPLAAKAHTVYFIDDSATMREVIKIAFKRENINVITCHDAASALSQFVNHAPDAIITDVIMPDKNGYEVCQYVKEHPEWSKTPVILMSGVVDRAVAEKATAVKADELIRKPFQPQDLIARVKKLLNPQANGEDSDPERPAHVLSSLFAPTMTAGTPLSAPRAASAAPARPASSQVSPAPRVYTPRSAAPPAPSMELSVLKSAVRRLELLVKKLQSELEAERQYNAALEEQIKTLQGID